MKSKIVALTFTALLSMYISGCGSSAGQEDSSTSGSIAGTLGGSMAASGGGSASAFYEPKKSKFELAHLMELILPEAFASSAVCPTIPTGIAGTNCTSGATTTLTYSSCSFPGSPAVWAGSQLVAFGGGPVGTCGAAFPTTMSSVGRTFGASTTRTSAANTVVTITTGVFNAFDSNNYSGGISVTFSGGVRTQVAIPGITLQAARGFIPLFSHTITTSPAEGTGAALVISGGNTIVSGTIATFHNLAKVEGESTFSNVQFSATCCFPVSGSITTTFTQVPGKTPLLPQFVGASESLTFTGCGTATYTGPEGYNGNVTMGHCI